MGHECMDAPLVFILWPPAKRWRNNILAGAPVVSRRSQTTFHNRTTGIIIIMPHIIRVFVRPLPPPPYYFTTHVTLNIDLVVAGARCWECNTAVYMSACLFGSTLAFANTHLGRNGTHLVCVLWAFYLVVSERITFRFRRRRRRRHEGGQLKNNIVCLGTDGLGKKFVRDIESTLCRCGDAHTQIKALLSVRTCTENVILHNNNGLATTVRHLLHARTVTHIVVAPTIYHVDCGAARAMVSESLRDRSEFSGRGWLS